MEQTQKLEIKPASGGYLYWHTLNHFKDRINGVMELVKSESQGDESIAENDLAEALEPIASDLREFTDYVRSLGQQDEDELIDNE